MYVRMKIAASALSWNSLSIALRACAFRRRCRGAGDLVGLAMLIGGLLLTGCEKPKQNVNTVHDTAVQSYAQKQPAASTQPAEAVAAAPRPGRPVASVNEVPIDRAVFIQTLLDARGLSLLQQIIWREVAQQESRRLGLAVTADDVDHEYDLTLQAAQYDGKDVERLTPARREQLIEEWTRSRGVAPAGIEHCHGQAGSSEEDCRGAGEDRRRHAGEGVQAGSR